MKVQFTAITLTSIFLLLSCADTVTDLGREATARPRIEQLALSNAIDLAFREVDFAEIIGKKVFIETQALSKLDIEFINAYISGLSIENNAIVVDSISEADIKIYNIVKTSGTDDIERKIFTDKVRGEYKSVLSFIDTKSMKVIKTYEISGIADEVR
jgi:hypothetical protein